MLRCLHGQTYMREEEGVGGGGGGAHTLIQTVLRCLRGQTYMREEEGGGGGGLVHVETGCVVVPA